AEVLAAAIKDAGAGRLFGVQTAGCTVTAEVRELGDGSALQVSTSKLLSSSGKELNHFGLSPDQEVSMSVGDLAAGRDPQAQAALTYLFQKAGINPNPGGAATPGGSPSASGTSVQVTGSDKSAELTALPKGK